jgi:hypothetical protein
MHLLFYGRKQMELLKIEWVEKLLREQSIKVTRTRLHASPANYRPRKE